MTSHLNPVPNLSAQCSILLRLMDIIAERKLQPRRERSYVGLLLKAGPPRSVGRFSKKRPRSWRRRMSRASRGESIWSTRWPTSCSIPW